MTTETLIKQQIKDLPESLKIEVLKFAESVRKKFKTIEKPKKREFGSHPGIKIADDFHAPLEDFKDYM